MSKAITEAMVEAAMAVHVVGNREGYVRRVLSAALSAGQAQPVAIKPLEWVVDAAGGLRANTTFGSYRALTRSSDYTSLLFEGNPIEPAHECGFETMGLAKAAAQKDFEARIRSALSAPLPEIEGGDKGDGWQTIDTAPKDGTSIDLWGVNHLTWDKRGERIVNVKWGAVSDWIGRERDDWQHGRGEDFEPTHWMPLPAAPSASIEGNTKP